MASTQHERILVVDDDPAVRDLIVQQVLQPQGYVVEAATDGATALQSALRTPPDIIITALDLPGLSGRDLITALRSQGFETTLIATGPRGADTQTVQAFRLGARDYLGKPLREAELVASLDHALAEVRLRRERETLAGKLAAANQQLEKRVKELTTLAGIGKAVTAVTVLGQLFTRLLEAGLFVTEADVGWLMLAEESAGKPILRAGKNLPNLSAIRLNQPWDDGISSLLMLSGEGLTLAGAALAKLRAGQVVKAAVAVPLKAKERVIGVIVAGNRTGRPFSERDQAMLSAVADYAVIAIVNGRFFQAMEARVLQLQGNLEALTADAARRDQQAQALAQRLRAPLIQARSTLEPLVHGQVGALTAQQAASLHAALERLTALQQLVDELPRPSGAAPKTTT
ncbi:MAG: response regulator [Anaerolineales bacterium]|nr:response regulator [Anaerolineales bacterium]